MCSSERSTLVTDKEQLLGQRGAVIWLYGLSGAGKSTLASALENALLSQGRLSLILDGDILRTGLNSNLGFSMEDRFENIRRAAETARLLASTGIIVIAALITPTRELRDLAHGIVGEDRFLEVYLQCSYSCCSTRDVKGLYRKARTGEVQRFTGNDSPFEAPDGDTAMVLDTEHLDASTCLDKLLSATQAHSSIA
ncbi:MAG: adenylyl-sulfate kinase [Roseimicrobium sp.]